MNGNKEGNGIHTVKTVEDQAFEELLESSKTHRTPEQSRIDKAVDSALEKRLKDT